MPTSNMIDHVCLAVKSIERASESICKFLGFHERTKIILNTKQDVNVLFLSKKNSIDIKLIEPASKNSPLINFLRKGEGLHHLGIKVDNVAKEIQRVDTLGARVTLHPEKGEAFCNELIAFYNLGCGLNIEVIDTDCREDM